MALPTIPTTLKRGVGRKILSLFLLASLLPVFFTAGLAYFEIQRSTEAEISRSLRASAKDYGLDLLGRLQRASLAAGNVQSMLEREGISGLNEHEYLMADFDGVWFQDEAGNIQTVVGNDALKPSNDELAILESFEAFELAELLDFTRFYLVPVDQGFLGQAGGYFFDLLLNILFAH